jgi:hypothetical protein
MDQLLGRDAAGKGEEVVGRPDPRIAGAAATLLEAGEGDSAPPGDQCS